MPLEVDLIATKAIRSAAAEEVIECDFVQRRRGGIRRNMSADPIFLAVGPRYFITALWLTNTAIAPAMKNAGTRHRRKCSCAYHLVSAIASKTDRSNRDQPSGRANTATKIARPQSSRRHSTRIVDGCCGCAGIVVVPTMRGALSVIAVAEAIVNP